MLGAAVSREFLAYTPVMRLVEYLYQAFIGAAVAEGEVWEAWEEEQLRHLLLRMAKT